jgi:hypothetical protein
MNRRDFFLGILKAAAAMTATRALPCDGLESDPAKWLSGGGDVRLRTFCIIGQSNWPEMWGPVRVSFSEDGEAFMEGVLLAPGDAIAVDCSATKIAIEVG